MYILSSQLILTIYNMEQESGRSENRNGANRARESAWARQEIEKIGLLHSIYTILRALVGIRRPVVPPPIVNHEEVILSGRMWDSGTQTKK